MFCFCLNWLIACWIDLLCSIITIFSFPLHQAHMPFFCLCDYFWNYLVLSSTFSLFGKVYYQYLVIIRYVVKTLDNAESVKLQYRSLAKVSDGPSSNMNPSKTTPSWLWVRVVPDAKAGDIDTTTMLFLELYLLVYIVLCLTSVTYSDPEHLKWGLLGGILGLKNTL